MCETTMDETAALSLRRQAWKNPRRVLKSAPRCEGSLSLRRTWRLEKGDGKRSATRRRIRENLPPAAGGRRDAFRLRELSLWHQTSGLRIWVRQTYHRM